MVPYRNPTFLFIHPFEPPHDKTSKMACVPSEDSDQPGHWPRLIRIFAVRMKKHWALNYLLRAQWILWSDWADAQADLSLRWAHMSFSWFCGAAAHIFKSFSSGLEFLQSMSTITAAPTTGKTTSCRLLLYLTKKRIRISSLIVTRTPTHAYRTI